MCTGGNGNLRIVCHLARSSQWQQLYPIGVASCVEGGLEGPSPSQTGLQGLRRRPVLVKHLAQGEIKFQAAKLPLAPADGLGTLAKASMGKEQLRGLFETGHSQQELLNSTYPPSPDSKGNKGC